MTSTSVQIVHILRKVLLISDVQMLVM